MNPDLLLRLLEGRGRGLGGFGGKTRLPGFKTQQGNPFGIPSVPQANSPGVPEDPSNLLEIFGASGFGQTDTLANTLLTLQLLSGGGQGGSSGGLTNLFSALSP